MIVRMATTFHTKSSGQRSLERAACLCRRLTSARGGCKGTLVALFWNAAAGQEQWVLGELAVAPRELVAGGVLGGVRARSRSTKPANAEVPVRLFKCAIGTSGKGCCRFRQPCVEMFAKFTNEYKCGKWHVELQPCLRIRPPLAATEEKGSSFRGR
jgi:hypothetical protein